MNDDLGDLPQTHGAPSDPSSTLADETLALVVPQPDPVEPPSADEPSGAAPDTVATTERAVMSRVQVVARTAVTVCLGAIRRHRVRSALAGVLVVVLVVGGVWWWRSSDPVRPGWARSPSSAVVGYLTAVAAGHATDAIAYLADPPADRSLLTDAVLAQSRELAPLTDIAITEVVHRYSVPVGYDDAAQVTATFQIGADSQTATFRAYKNGGYWSVEGIAQVVLCVAGNYCSHARDLVPIQVNGVLLRSDTITVFPGRYQATSGHQFVELDHQFTVESPTRPGYWNPELTEVTLSPRLTDTATRRIGDAARAQLESCLAQTSFDTDCDFLVREYVRFDRLSDSATITWSIGGSTADLPDPGTGLGWWSLRNEKVMGISGIAVPVEIQLRCTWTDADGQSQSRDVHFSTNYYLADATDPDHIVITFGHEF
ncbi:MAG: hypothetical protein FWD11_09150 [Micrococcales bacterium]|nr:hypothetical protein [Micrococcales bacterium]